MAGFCPACGAEPGETHDAARCAARLELDPPRYCARCGRRLDVQVFPLGVRATCRRCDGVHPAHR
ncbi:hypothetical protein [Nitriliruptor alkaliphilus]|uniref:biotin synthase auxiliary protein BsaP n=1 Tax=Nitriliruptor alkaliphilus TaxID=427918 RepID=UPI00069856E2|nr:hypothetical protein [Nitriliruptor alkaliphilus]